MASFLTRSSFALLSLLFIAFTFADETDSSKLTSDEAIREAITQLGSSRFHEREKATRKIWLTGLAAEPILRETIKDQEPEVRLRIRNILLDFDFGILPSTPQRERELIVAFRDGNAASRRVAFGNLLQDGAYESVQRLIAREENSVVRQSLLMQMFTNANVVEDYIELDRIETLIDQVGEDQDADWRRDMTSKLMFSPVLISQLAKANKLNSLLQFIEKEDVPAIRRFRLMTFFSNVQTLQMLAQEHQFGFALSMLDFSADKAERTEMVSIVFTSPLVSQALIEKRKFLSVLDSLAGTISEDVERTILLRVMNHQPSITLILQRDGFDKLIAFGDRLKDPQQRGELLGNIVASSSVLMHLNQRGELNQIAKLADRQGDPEAKVAFVKALLGSNALFSLQDPDAGGILLAILRLAKASGDKTLVETAVTRLIRLPAFSKLLENKQDAIETLDSLAQADANTVGTALMQLSLKPDSVKLFIQHDLFAKLITVACKSTAQMRDQILYRVLSRRDIFEDVTNDQRDELLVTTSKKLAVTERWSFIGAILRSQIMYGTGGASIQNHFIDLIREVDDKEERGLAVSAVAGSSQVITKLVTAKDRKWIMESLPHAKADAVQRLVTRIVSSSIQRKPYINEGYFEPLLKQIERVETNRRGTMLQSLVSSSEVAEYLLKKKSLSRLLELVSTQTDDVSRAQILQGVFRNSSAMKSLINAGKYQEFEKLIEKETADIQRAQLWADFMGAPAVVEHLVSSKKFRVILDFLKSDSKSQRNAFLLKILSNTAGMNAIVDAGHFDLVYEILSKEEDMQERGRLVNAALISPATRSHLITQDKLLPVFDDALRIEGLRLTFAEYLFQDEKAVAMFSKAGRMGDLLSLAGREADPYRRLRIQQRLVSSKAILAELIAMKQLDLLYKLIAREPEDKLRGQLISSLFRSSSSLEVLLKGKQLTKLIDLVRSQPDAGRGQMLGSLLSSKLALQELKDKEQLDSIFVWIDEISTDSSRQYAISRVLTQSDVRQFLVSAGKLESILRWIDEEPNEKNRGRYISYLLGTTAAQQIIDSGRLELVFEAIRTQSSSISVLATLCNSQQTVDAMRSKGYLKQLIQVVVNLRPDKTRENALIYILESPYVCAALDPDEQIQPWIDTLLKSDVAATQNRFKQSVTSRSHLHEYAVNAGYFDTIEKWIKASSTSSKNTLLLNFYMTPASRQHLTEDGRFGVITDLIRSEASDSRRQSLLTQLVGNHAAASAYLDAVKLKSLLELIDSLGDPYQTSGYSSVLFSASVMKYLAKSNEWMAVIEALKEKPSPVIHNALSQLLSTTATAKYSNLYTNKLALPAVISLMEADEEKYHKSHFDRICSNRLIRWTSLKNGQYDLLRSIAAKSNNPSYYQEELLYSETGVVARRIHDGDFEEAERLLLQQDDPDGHARVASFYRLTGALNEKLAALKSEREKSGLINALERAAGNGSEILDRLIPKQLSLATQIAAEQRDWERAAKLHVEAFGEIKSMESLGQLATFLRLSGETVAADTTLKDVVRLAKVAPKDAKLQRQAAIELLLNDKIDEALSILKHRDNARFLFELRCYRQEQDRALREIGWNDETESKWFANLIDKSPKTNEAYGERVLLTFCVARELSRLGKDEQALSLVKESFKLIDDIPTGRFSESSLETDCGKILGRTHLFEDVLLMIVEEHGKSYNLGNSLRRVLAPVSVNEADVSGWWYIIYYTMRDSSAEGQAKMFYDILRHAPTIRTGGPHGEMKPSDFLVETRRRLMQRLRSYSSSTSNYQRVALASAMRGYGMFDEAIDFIDTSIDIHDYRSLRLLADMLRASEQWGRSAETYYQLWEADPSKVIALYLSGESLLRAAETEPKEDRRKKMELTGAERQRNAKLMVSDVDARYGLLRSMGEYDLVDAMLEECRLLKSVAPPGSFAWHECCRRLAYHAEPAESAALMQDAIMMNLRSRYQFNSPRSNLILPRELYVSRAKAAIQSGDIDATKTFVDTALRSSPGSIELCESLLPLLAEKKEAEVADSLYTRVVSQFRSQLTKFPESASLNNDIAWLQARSNRDLNEALQFASKAVTLEPKNPGFMDTLAEVHFRRGDRAKAVAIESDALQLDPRNEHIQTQLERFRGEE